MRLLGGADATIARLTAAGFVDAGGVVPERRAREQRERADDEIRREGREKGAHAEISMLLTAAS